MWIYPVITSSRPPLITLYNSSKKFLHLPSRITPTAVRLWNHLIHLPIYVVETDNIDTFKSNQDRISAGIGDLPFFTNF